LNLVLLEPGEMHADGTARLAGRRATHVREVLRAGPGARIQAGLIGGRLGSAEIVSCADAGVVLRPALDLDPPAPSPIALLLALPRPKILRRVLQATAAMGVKRIVLLGSWKVEKSYFASPLLEPAALRSELLLGLEQGRDTILPEISVRRFFRPFVEDELDAAFAQGARLLAHPGAAPVEALPAGGACAALAIGPEGGWTRYEADALRARGFSPFSLGPRALRVDAAVPFAVGQAELWLRTRPARAAD
jgi:16S rRNA (uracil1498-N3)-methyltransferase